jgi:hypothetical protein
MKSQLSQQDIINFYIRLYFDTSEGYTEAAMKRAYRDFNRTILNIPCEGHERAEWRHKLYHKLKELISMVLENDFGNQSQFDVWHEAACETLMEASNNILLVGQAQKWINMTLKYLFAFGENIVPGISRNYQFFHLPIDSIIQYKFEQKYGVQRLPIAWSRVGNYDQYYSYQLAIRKALPPGRIMMDEEFISFNER